MIKMDKRSGKGLSFAKRIYLPRVIGLGIGLFSVMAAMAPAKVRRFIITNTPADQNSARLMPVPAKKCKQLAKHGVRRFLR